jgi:hypothetical protein
MPFMNGSRRQRAFIAGFDEFHLFDGFPSGDAGMNPYFE